MKFEHIPPPQAVAEELGIPPEAVRRAIGEVYYCSPDLTWSNVELGPDRLGEVASLAARLQEALSDDREYLRLVDAVGEEALELVEAVGQLRDAAQRAHHRQYRGRPPLPRWMNNVAEIVRDLCKSHGVAFTAGFEEIPCAWPRSPGAWLLTSVARHIDPKVPVERCRTVAERMVKERNRP